MNARLSPPVLRTRNPARPRPQSSTTVRKRRTETGPSEESRVRHRNNAIARGPNGAAGIGRRRSARKPRGSDAEPPERGRVPRDTDGVARGPPCTRVNPSATRARSRPYLRLPPARRKRAYVTTIMIRPAWARVGTTSYTSVRLARRAVMRCDP